MENNKSNAANPEEFAAMQAAQGEVLAAQEEEIKELKAKLSDLASSQGERVVVVKSGQPVTVGKKNYLVVHGLIVDDKELSVAQIAADKPLLEKLVAARSSAIQAV
jgi:hypothetical protein